jgi:ubiquitin-like protein Pup
MSTEDNATTPPSTRSDELIEDLEVLLDEIDDVLEENAEEFVKQYVQRGGNGGGFGFELAEELGQRLTRDSLYSLFDLLHVLQEVDQPLRQEIITERWGPEIAELISHHLDEEPDGLGYFLRNLPNFGIEWDERPSRIVSHRDVEATLSAHRLVDRAERALPIGDFRSARRWLLEAEAIDPVGARWLRREFGFVLRWRSAPSDILSLEWVVALRAAVGHRRRSVAASRRPLNITDVTMRAAQVEGQTARESRRADPLPADHASTSQQRGASLEEHTLRLFRTLFEISDETQATVLSRLRRQFSGSQFGRDLEFDCTAVGNRMVRCHVECKNYTGRVPLPELAGKLAQQELRHTGGRDVDHWILISPRAPAANDLNEAIDQWNNKARYPFNIQSVDARHRRLRVLCS